MNVKETGAQIKKFGGIILAVGVILCIFGFREGVAAMKTPVDLYEVSVSEIGTFDMVTADIYAVFGTFATKTTSENGRKTAEESYYLIPAYEGDDIRYVGVKVLEKDYDTFDAIRDDTWEFEDGYLVELTKHAEKTGCLKKMNKKMQDLYYDTLREAEWFESEEEMKTYALPYYIDSLANPSSMKTFLFVGVLLAVVGGVLFFVGFKKQNAEEKKAAEQSYVYINGVSYAKASLAHVNQCVLGQEKMFAVQELAQITGMSMEEASMIIENWRQYYY
ncbi:MAG: hypothetical protein K6F51_15135 [Acetatifactor sp.]|nr:hypothetical protein [Acetatifactor sp.]